MSISASFSIKKKGFALDVTMEIPAAGITGLFGPSGCGKTTLLRAIAGLERCTKGHLQIGDTIWQNESVFVPPHRREVGYVFQEPSLFPHLDVRGNLEYGLRRVPSGARRLNLEQAIELLGIDHLLQRHSSELSGGERQRVAIARALAINPKILLLDEPLSALDMQRKREIMPFLESLHDELKIPVLYVSHAADEMARLTDHLLLLDQGRITACGQTAQMLTRLDLPLAHGDEASAIIQATVHAHDAAYGLSILDFPGGRITVPGIAMDIGRSVRLRISAHDVSLTRTQQQDTSILNIFPVTVEEATPEGNSQMVVRLNAAGVPLLSRITRKSADMLGVRPGISLFAQVKSVVLLS